MSLRPRTLLLVAATIVSAAVALWAAFVIAPQHPFNANDSHAYWAVTVEGMYDRGLAPNEDAFLYTPPIGLVAATFSALPFEAFLAVWQTIHVAVLVAMAGPLAGPLALLPIVGTELAAGPRPLVAKRGFRARGVHPACGLPTDRTREEP